MSAVFWLTDLEKGDCRYVALARSADGMVTVTTIEGASETTQLGGMPAEILARHLHSELIAKAIKER